MATPVLIETTHQYQQSDPEQHQDAFSRWFQAKQQENTFLQLEARADRERLRVPVIVVVDDEKVVAITLAEILRRHGFIVIWFDDACSALKYLEKEPVDLLLSDITTPMLDGIDLAERAHAVQPGCSLFLFSALSGVPDTMSRLNRMHLPVHLESKPLQIPALLTQIKLLLGDSTLAPQR